ncbi:MAG TPA: AraC family transcriptional regulator [Smithellaceae bacterium]|nr:AraC family transcriptional regulator [Smithellaceae bacterium]
MRENHTITSCGEYSDQLQRAVDYIQDHFAKDLSLEKLAAVACYSKYHFHRLFRETFGETVNNRIRRVRLEHAAYRLSTEINATVDEIASSCGFSSSQNFARAFTAHFGFSPTSVRKHPGHKIIGQSASGGKKTCDRTQLDIQIQEWPSCRVACIRDIGPYRSESNDRAIERLLQWAAAAGHIDAGAKLIGVYWSDFEATPLHQCVFDACLPVPESAKGNREVCIQPLSGGKLAVLHCEVEWEQIPAQRNRLIFEWLPASGCIRDERPFFVVFYNNPHMNRRKLAIVDMCLPIKS